MMVNSLQKTLQIAVEVENKAVITKKGKCPDERAALKKLV